MKRLCGIAVALCLMMGVAQAFNFDFGFSLGGKKNAVQWIDLLPSLSWSPSSKAFGNQSTNVAHSQLFTLSNSGNDTAEEVVISATGTSFRYYSSTCGTQPFNLAVGANCTTKVEFKPLTAASFTGYLNYSAPNIAKTAANLTGTGVAPPDTTPPTLSSATIPSAGTSISLAFNEAVSVGAGGNGGWTITPSGGAATMSYASGSGSSTLVYNLNRTVNSGETGTVAYTQPGNGIEDAAGNDLATIPSASVTNNSTQSADPYTSTRFAYSFNVADGSNPTSTADPVSGHTWASESDGSSLGAIASAAYTVVGNGTSTAAYLQKNPLTVVTDWQLKTDLTLSSANTGSASTYYRILSTTGASYNSAHVELITNGSSVITQVRVKYQRGDNTEQQYTASFSPSAGTPYTITLNFKHSSDTVTSNGSLQLLINGTEYIAPTAITTYSANTNLLTMGIRLASGSYSNTWSFKNLTLKYK